MHKCKSIQAGQLPQEHLPFLQNLLNFIITKYLKQEVDEYLNVCVDERSHYGLHLRRSTQWNPFNNVYLLSKFDASSFSVTGD